MKPILEIRNAAARYGAIAALKGVSLSVDEGEIVCLIGANGAGKSTLLKTIVGMVPLSGGEILFRGETIAREPAARAGRFPPGAIARSGLRTDRIVARGVSLVPEGREVFAGMTVMENLEMGAFLTRDPRRVRARADEAFALFPALRDRRGQKAGSLSGGEQQMLSIARSLMSEPSLLLLDEPGLGLAPLLIRDIFDAVVRINRERKATVFLVEQNARMALAVSSRGFVMETGVLTLADSSAALLADPKVKSAYLGED
jgi:branched-chain amino acid transport system ATP-binding protein